MTTSSHDTPDEETKESDLAADDATEPTSDFGPPFESRSFGGEFVWADAEHYTAKILRVKAGENVIVSTRGRRDMIAMLTGGRGILEIVDGDNSDQVELMPAMPVAIQPGPEYRLVAVTEAELFTVYSPADS